MGIFDRMKDAFRANFNAAFDGTQDPKSAIDLSVQDMADQIKRARSELISTLGNAKRLEKKAKELAEEAQSWEDKAILALRENNDTLAKEALKRKKRVEKETLRASTQSARLFADSEQMKSQLERAENKLDDLKARKGKLAAQISEARQVGTSTRSTSAFGNLEQMMDDIDQLDAEVEAHGLLKDDAKLEQEFRALENKESDLEVDDELSNLKSKLLGEN